MAAKVPEGLPPGAIARGRWRKQSEDEVARTFAKLREIHPDAHCELNHASPFQLIVATVLSAQTTDVNVNRATPALFARYPTAQELAAAKLPEVERFVGPLGFFRQKAKAIVGLAAQLVRDHGGEVPKTLAELVKLPGVGRKTANVVLGVAFGTPEGVVVDTHVQRISQRLGWTKSNDPQKIEQDLCALIPRQDWDLTGHLLIFHGRRICFAAKPNCAECGVDGLCPSAFRAENIGRKPGRAGTPKPAPSAKKAKKGAKGKPKKKVLGRA